MSVFCTVSITLEEIILVRDNLKHWYILWGTQLEISLSKKNLVVLVVLVDTNLNISQQCALISEKVSGILICIRRNGCQEVEEGNPSFCAALVSPHLIYCNPFLVHENISESSTKGHKGVERAGVSPL